MIIYSTMQHCVGLGAVAPALDDGIRHADLAI